MISRIARLRAKKGFTIIELIVVIAIIGILTAMIVPALSYDNKPAIAKAMAKEMFYRTQEVMSDCKAAGSGLHDTYCTCYYAEINDQGIPVEMGYFSVDSGGNIEAAAKTAGTRKTISSASTDKTDLKMVSMMEKYLTSEPTMNMAGHLVVCVDYRYRVVASYWFENFDWVGNNYFEDDYILATGQYAAAYPPDFCVPGSHRTFKFDKLIASS